ncbi:MAG: HAMP domain-containing sensor histidine kinase, partial [Chloroflexota bacterium]|nr:HAMP domain-containing sensor histidine kinase [Chloroflexota bacterium]
FISNVSHELRTPITIIKLYAQMLPSAPPEKLPEYFDILISTADHQAELVKNILQISSLEGGRMTVETEPTALSNLVAEVFEKCRRGAVARQLELVFRPAAISPQVLVDPLPFKMAVRNLLRNATHYTLAAGQITVTTGLGEREGRTWGIVSVQDTGIGIPPDELSHIFERFYRGAAPRAEQISGTGLGLAITKGIMDLHGGLITVTSEVGVGTIFTIWAPLAV